MLRPTLAKSSRATSSTARISLRPRPRRGREITPAPRSRFRTAATPACSYCVIPFVRGKSRSLPPDAVIREIQASVKRDTAKSSSAASISAPTAAISPPASSSKISSAVFLTKHQSSVSASAPSNRWTSPKTSSISLLPPIASPTLPHAAGNPPPTASSPPCTAGTVRTLCPPCRTHP